jgi:hypothetical protein
VIFSSVDGTTFSQVQILPPNSVTYTDLGLQPSFAYYYRVVPVNRGGQAIPLEDFTFTNDLFWNSVASTGPGARAAHSAVYDKTGQRMIVYGGDNILLPTALYNDVAQLSLPDPTGGPPVWSSLTVTGAVTGRAGHSAVYDSALNLMIVFGGQTQSATVNELWVLNLNTSPAQWSPVTSSSVPYSATGIFPSARRNHTAIYDPVRHEMVVFGGSSGGTVLLDDSIYVLKVNSTGPFAWTSPIGPGGPPLWRDLHSAAFDSLSSNMILFAGHDSDPNNPIFTSQGDGSSLNQEIWALSPGPTYGWTLKSINGGPGLQEGHTAVYDKLNQRMVVLGGGDDLFNPLAPPNMYALNLWGSQGWTLMTPAIAGPVGLTNHTAVYDELFSRMVIFGGHPTKLTYTNETWWIAQ